MAALEGVEPALREGLSGRAVDVMLVCVFLLSRVDGAALRARASTGVDGGADAQPLSQGMRFASFGQCALVSRRSSLFRVVVFKSCNVASARGAAFVDRDAAAHGSSAFTGVSEFG